MKQIRFLSFVLVVGTLLLSACGATPSTATPVVESTAQKVEAMPVAFVGIVDSMAGDQWVISGTTVTVDESIVRDGPFHVADRIKVEGFTKPDGSFTVSRVEAPTPQEVATLPPVSVDNSNEAISNTNTNDANVNDDNSSGLNSNDDNSNAANSNVNDDHGTDVNSNDDNSNSANTNDASTNVNDNNGGGNSNSGVDNSNTANSNDDNGGGNSNDNKGSGSNSNDDNGGGGGNSNDDNGNGG
jgi:hypothetical protein